MAHSESLFLTVFLSIGHNHRLHKWLCYWRQSPALGYKKMGIHYLVLLYAKYISVGKTQSLQLSFLICKMISCTS